MRDFICSQEGWTMTGRSKGKHDRCSTVDELDGRQRPVGKRPLRETCTEVLVKAKHLRRR
jgi:hypothetical protein